MRESERDYAIDFSHRDLKKQFVKALKQSINPTSQSYIREVKKMQSHVGLEMTIK